ncbi:hypothetical protein [Actinomadura sp. J1-007]|uniref:hypothetical protein n=1 Tax=Actinomadura sp. J1-007 TaxID=2661913 RepID=UPI001371CB90|nr:hypothetical protein [Actinomadura sp. J1-007]
MPEPPSATDATAPVPAQDAANEPEPAPAPEPPPEHDPSIIPGLDDDGGNDDQIGRT